jgi:hypothetical protein
MEEPYFSDDDSFDEDFYYECLREEEEYQNLVWHAYGESRHLLKEIIQKIEEKFSKKIDFCGSFSTEKLIFSQEQEQTFEYGF